MSTDLVSRAAHCYGRQTSLLEKRKVLIKYRNPDFLATGTWCYTTDPGSRWEECEVPSCHGMFKHHRFYNTNYRP